MTEAALKPACGRASAWSSTITAIGCRCATSGVTGSPVSGAGTRGSGVGDGGAGVAVGAAVAPGAFEARTTDGSGECVAAAAPPGVSVPMRAVTAIASAAIEIAIRVMSFLRSGQAASDGVRATLPSRPARERRARAGYSLVSASTVTSLQHRGSRYASDLKRGGGPWTS